MQKGKIKNLKIFTEKGKPGETVQSACCVADCGLQGDRFATGGEKQLTIMDESCENWLCSQDMQGLCFKRFKANVIVADMDISAFKTGEKLLCGDAELEFSAENKECFSECVRVQNKADCMLRNHAKYLKVLKNGKININDKITKTE